jgi:hypothetical protein
MSNLDKTTGFVVKDWSHLPENAPLGADPVISVVSTEDIWQVLDDAKQNNKRISVYAIGACLIDWSQA